MSGPSRSLAIYARLLALYPAEIGRRHRSEMLQNFEDLERASSSTVALWLGLGKDLVTSVVSHWIRPMAFARQFIIVLAVLAVAATIGSRRHDERGSLVWVVCAGYAIGWVSGWSQRRAVVVLALIGIAVSASIHQRLALSICYGCTLGWVGGWVGKRSPIRSWRARRR